MTEQTAISKDAAETAEVIKLLEQMNGQLTQQNAQIKKQLRASRITSVAVTLTAIVLAIAMLALTRIVFNAASQASVLMTQASGLMQTAEQSLSQVEGMMQTAEAALNDLSAVSQQLSAVDFAGMLQRVDELITETQTGLNAALGESQSALQKIQQIDIASLNQSIADLRAVITPLKNLFGFR